MKLLLTRTAAQARPIDLSVDVEEGVTVGQLASTLAPDAVGGPFTLKCADGTVLDALDAVAGSGLWIGDSVRVVSIQAGSTDANSSPALEVLAGADVGHRLRLSAGENTVGRADSSSVVVDEPTLSRTHFRISVDEAVEVTDLNSANGTFVDGERLSPSTTLGPGAIISAGNAQFRFRPATKSKGTRGSGGPTLFFNRPPRIEPRYAGRSFKAPTPPSEPDPEPFGWAFAFVPILMAGVLYAITRNVASIAFALLSPAMIIGSWWQSRSNAQRKFEKETARFREDVTALERSVQLEQEAESVARRLQAPDTPLLMQSVAQRTTELWARAVQEPDFLLVRVGAGDQPSIVAIEVPDGGDRGLRAAIETLPGRYGTVPDVPVEADLKLGGIGIAGLAGAAESSARSVLTQIAALHSPAEVAVAALLSEEEAAKWEWLKWLPHTRFPLSPLHGEHLAATPAASADLVRRIGAMVELRTGVRPDAGSMAQPWLVVVIDERARLDRPVVDQLLKAGSSAGVTFIWLARQAADLPRFCRYVVTLDQKLPVLNITTTGTGDISRAVRADLVEPELMNQFVRQLAPLQDLSARTAKELDLPNVVLLSEMLGGEDILTNHERVHDRWRTNGQSTRTLKTPIGAGQGEDFFIDIVRQGPHGFLIGTTGSGKSELLRTLLVSMAASYGPERVNYLLIDFKGGAALKPFLELPHTIGLVTNLREGEANADEKLEGKVRRTIVWLRAELQRRMQTLDAAGVSDIADMEQREIEGTPPRLIIVADEFAVLTKGTANNDDDVIDEIVNIARLGRSLGIHLLLATQRAAGVISDNIRANTNLRIALRVQDIMESTDVINAPDAAAISLTTPGRGFVAIGAGNLTQFQTASSTGHTRALKEMPRVRVEPFTFVGRAPVASEAAVLPAGTGPNDLEMLTSTIKEASSKWPIDVPDSHWVDPPGDVISLAAIADPAQEYEVAIGVIDDPATQSVRPAVIDLRASGSAVIFGAGGSGKTVLLRTIAASLARRSSPADLRMYALDFGGRGMAMLAGLPQMGSVVAGDDVDRVYRLFRELRKTVDNRLTRIATAGFSDLYEYRVVHRQDEDRASIVVFIDGLSGFVDKFQDLDGGTLLDGLTSLIFDGRSAGLHFIVSATRRQAAPSSILGALQSQIVLRMANSDDYSMVDVRPSDIPLDPPPGQGLLGRFRFQAAIVTTVSDAADMANCEAGHDEEQVELITEQIRSGDAQARALIEAAEHSIKRYGDSRCEAIGSLVTDLAADALPSTGAPWCAHIGISGLTLEPLLLDLRQAHFIVAGPPRSGRSTSLVTLASALRVTTPNLHCVLIAPRQTEAHDAHCWMEKSTNESEAVELLDGLATRSHVAPLLVCVDDFTDLDEMSVNGALSQLLQAAKRGSPIRLVLCGDSKGLGRTFGEAAMGVRRYRTGMLLQPDFDFDGDLLGVRLPRRSWASFPAGRGFLVQGSDVQYIQGART